MQTGRFGRYTNVAAMGGPPVFTVSYIGTGATASGNTSILVPYPTSPLSGDMLILTIGNKLTSSTPSTPSGWTLLSTQTGGNGVDGAGTGPVRASVYYKISDGTETGNLTVTITSGNSAVGVMRLYRKTGGTWSITGTSGTDTTANTSWSATGSSWTVANGNMVQCFAVSNLNSTVFSAQTLAMTGLTGSPVSLTNTTTDGTTTGNDVRFATGSYSVTQNLTDAPIHAMTASASTADGPTGVSQFIRLAAA